MEYAVGRVVRSKAGRDAGLFFTVVGMDGAAVLLCDGKRRPIERPKRKNVRHIAATQAMLSAHQMETNREVRKALHLYSEKSADSTVQGG